MRNPGPDRCWALVPVKPLAQAKQRLASRLSGAARIRLARAMLTDVLSALSATPGLAGLLVVTADPQVAPLAAPFAARIVPEDGAQGLNGAIARGIAQLPAEAGGVMVVPADIPFATPDEFTAVLAALRHFAVVLAPALGDGGTNTLAMRPPGAIGPQFGPDSFRRHQKLAAAGGHSCGIVHGSGLGRDIDRPTDLLAASHWPSRTATAALLPTLAAGRRCGARDSSGYAT